MSLSARSPLPAVPPALAPPARKLAAVGTDTLSDAEVVALLLRAPIPAARALLELAGGLHALARHEASEVAGLPGIGRSRSVVLAAAFELGRRAARAEVEPGWRIRSPADVGERLSAEMGQLEREELRVLLLNTKNVVTGLATIYIGNLAGSSVRVGEVYRDAVRRQAAALVVVHNHPSGDPTPSGEDVRITAELAEAGRLLDIELLDHVIVAAEGWVSLRALGAA